ncbi:MAG: GAF domain-containing protein [Nitrospirae bacterium]|nr:GAF domain-containing protein [Nitrospirota bacterium]
MSIYSVPTFIGAILVFLIGVFTFAKNKKSGTNISFALFCLSVFIWLFSYTIAYSAKRFEIVTFFCNVACTAVMFTAPTFYHFSVQQLGFQKFRKTIIIPYMIIGIFMPLFLLTDYFLRKPHKTFWGYYSTAGPLHPLYLLMHFTIVGVGFLLLFMKYFKTPETAILEKRRLKYIFVSYVLAAIGAIDFTQKYGANFYPFGFMFIVSFVVVTAYAILRYRLMDIKLVFTRTMAYSISIGILTGIFAFLIFFATKSLSKIAQADSFIIYLAAALIIAFLFNPMRVIMQKLIDRVFYKKTFDYYETMKKMGQDLVSMLESEKIFSYIGETLFNTMNLKSIYLLSHSPDGNYFEAVYDKSHSTDKSHQPEGKALKIDGASDLFRLLKTPNDAIIKYDLPAAVDVHGEEAIISVINTMKSFHSEAIVPVFVDAKIAVLMVLGEKRSGDMFSDEDLSFLKTIAGQAAFAINNARLHMEKVQSEKFTTMGVMSAAFAHEIRNSVTSIKTFAQLMPEKYDDKEFRDVFSKMALTDVHRMDTLIKDLLDFSTGGASISGKDINAAALLDETLEHLRERHELGERNVEVRKSYDGKKIFIKGDDKMLRQVFINIMTNGCQAMKQGGILGVAVKPNGSMVEIDISDTGEGIAQENLKRIFEPFFTTRSAGIGLGLGLAISRKIIEDHCGNITVSSDLNKGTTFTVFLPVYKKDT